MVENMKSCVVRREAEAIHKFKLNFAAFFSQIQGEQNYENTEIFVLTFLITCFMLEKSKNIVMPSERSMLFASKIKFLILQLIWGEKKKKKTFELI